MRTLPLNESWFFGPGPLSVWTPDALGDRTVSLPHDYMIETDVFPDAVSQSSSGYYNAGVAHYVKDITIPADWAGDSIFLLLDGAENRLAEVAFALIREDTGETVRTTHNPPSAALIEACDRLGMYVFDEIFDVWGMGKQPDDYSAGRFTSYQGRALAVLRSGTQAGEVTLTVAAEGLGSAALTLPVKD